MQLLLGLGNEFILSLWFLLLCHVGLVSGVFARFEWLLILGGLLGNRQLFAFLRGTNVRTYRFRLVEVHRWRDFFVRLLAGSSELPF